jgi:hypothetical protein
MHRRALHIAICIAACLPAAHAVAAEGFFFCANVEAGECIEWVSVIDGVLSLSELGITPGDMGKLFALGFGIVIAPWIIARIAAGALRTFKNAVGENER